MKLLLLNLLHASIKGLLVDAGHDVSLLDADLEAGREALRPIAERAAGDAPNAILMGHSGSASAHHVIAEISREIRDHLPHAVIIYRGVYPTFHWREILEREDQIDIIVRGEGDETCVRLLHELRWGGDFRRIEGLAYRRAGIPVATAPVIENVERSRVG